MAQKITSLADKFKVFVGSLNVENQNSISSRFKDMTRQFNLKYWGSNSDTRNVHYIGSYGRGTAIKGLRNINILAVLPQQVFEQYNSSKGNGQKQLIEEVRDFLLKTYPFAHINEECHLLIPFKDITFEFIPSFINARKNYVYPDIHEGGTWVTFNPIREIEVLDELNYKYNGKIKHLAKIMRAWKGVHNVPISGMLLDTLALNFMEEWEANDKSYSYYGVMTQDFMEYLASRRKEQLHWYAKGSNRELPSNEDFGVQANIAYKETIKAMKYESEGDSLKANKCWKGIFGDSFPD